VERGEWLEVFEDGEIIRDFVYVDDVVEAFGACARIARAPASPINIGSGVPTSILSMARSVLNLYGRSPDDHHVTGNFRAGDVRHAVAEIALARDMLNWQPRTGFAAGLKHFVEWAKQSQAALI
jgi:dTDP-L-rhamnose 4-epimerase